MGSIYLQGRADSTALGYTVSIPVSSLSLSPGWALADLPPALVWSIPLPCLGLLVDPVPAIHSAPLHADAVGEHTVGVGPTHTRVPPGSWLVSPHGAAPFLQLGDSLCLVGRSCFNRFCLAFKMWLNSNVDGSNVTLKTENKTILKPLIVRH